MTFQTTPPALARALAERDYKDATPVQAAVLEEEAEGRDLLVSAQTGSGKTIAYGLAIADTLLDGAETMGPAGEPLALIIAPTRELALQVSANWPGSIIMPARASSPASAAWIRAASAASWRRAPISWSARRDGCAIIWNAAP